MTSEAHASDPKHTEASAPPPNGNQSAVPDTPSPDTDQLADPARVSFLDTKALDDLRRLEAIRRDGASANLPTTPIPGYDILGELGRGGMGMVYRARQRALKRSVALKMILATGQADLDSLARFMREAETVARMQHPNVLQIYEIGKHEGRLFFAMEFVDGGSLEQLISGQPQSPREAAEMVEILARAMEYVHQQGIVHRDLKPSNILLLRATGKETGSGVRLARRSGLDAYIVVPKICDFGLAKSLDESERLTATGDIVGTLSYMSPEQADGQKDRIGPLSDVYALGTILYEMLTGRAPFLGESPAATLMQVLEEEPVPPSHVHPKVPRDLEVICLKCLEKDTAKRYQGAIELAEDLRRFLNKEAIRARPIQPLDRIYRWSKRNPRLTALAAVLLLLAFSGMVGAVWLYSRLAELRRQAETRETDARLYAEQLRQSLEQTLAAGTAMASAAEVPGDQLVAWARSYARASALVAEDGPLAERYAQRAVELLRKARSLGWFRDPANAEQLQSYSEFDGIRQRVEFQELLGNGSKKR